jgi:TPR repeat protein
VKAGSCPFCREPATDDENEKRLMKRIKANDPVAMRHKGKKYYREGDYDAAFEYLTKAAELGDLEAHWQLGSMFRFGQGVEKDEEKAVYHCEKAAIGGHPDARFGLGVIELGNGKIERAVKHFMIAAKLGDDTSMKHLWKYYSAGYHHQRGVGRYSPYTSGCY